jgi:hypothetical protein
MAEPNLTLLDHRLGALSPALWRQKIGQIADDLSQNRYLQLAIGHAALSLHTAVIQEDTSQKRATSTKENLNPSETVAGLRRASSELKASIDEIIKKANWPELNQAKAYAGYATLRRIILDQYRTPAEDNDRELYYWFLALLLLYLVARGASEQAISRRPAYRALRLFTVEDYLAELVFPSTLTEDIVQYEFPKSTAKVSDLLDVLKTEFNIENPNDPNIATFFNVLETKGAFVCYRYSTRPTGRGSNKKVITKSYLQIEPPTREKQLFSFWHRYANVDSTVRTTAGFVVRLEQAIYLVGGTLRRPGRSAVGVKVIVIRTSDSNTWYAHHYISGLFLSSDSSLYPITGRLLLVRIPDCEDEESQAQHCGRISEKEFNDEVRRHSISKALIKESDLKEFLASMRQDDDAQHLNANIGTFIKNRR